MALKDAYHLDLHNRLFNGIVSPILNYRVNHPVIDPYIQKTFPHGISAMGAQYLTYCSITDTKKIIAFATEYIFESVRREQFSNLPSRFQALFASYDAQGISLWFNQLASNEDISKDELLKSATVKKIIYDDSESFKADAMWRDYVVLLADGSHRFSPTFIHEMAIHYWNGIITDSPRHEVLISLPVTVVDSIPLEEFLLGNV